MIGSHYLAISFKKYRQVVAFAVVDAITAASRTTDLEAIACEGVRTRIIHGIAALYVAAGNIAGVVTGHFHAGYVDFILGGGIGHHAAHGGKHE